MLLHKSNCLIRSDFILFSKRVNVIKMKTVLHVGTQQAFNTANVQGNIEISRMYQLEIFGLEFLLL